MMGLDGLAARGLNALGFSSGEAGKDVSLGETLKNETKTDISQLVKNIGNELATDKDNISSINKLKEEDASLKNELNKLIHDIHNTNNSKNIKNIKNKIDIIGTQKQKVTQGKIGPRIAGNKNNVRGGELHHNDKLPTPDGKIYSPINGTVISIKNNYKENKNGWSLKNPNFGNYVIILVEGGKFNGLTYHLGHIDKNIPLAIGDKVNIGQHIGNIKYGSGSGTGRHFSDAFGKSSSSKMISPVHKGYEKESSKLANVIIKNFKDNGVAIYGDGSKSTSMA